MAARPKKTSPLQLEPGQRWAYPLGDGRYVALQIGDPGADGAHVAFAFDAVFEGVPAAAQLDTTPWLRWELRPLNGGAPALGAFARFPQRAAFAPVRAVRVDAAVVRPDAEPGAPNIPFSSTFAEVALRVWQHWHLRSVVGDWGRRTLERPLHERWHIAKGEVVSALENMREEPPPIVLSIQDCSDTTLDLSAIRAQAIVIDAGRGGRPGQVILPPHLHTLAVWGTPTTQRFVCAPEGPPLQVVLCDGPGQRIEGLEAVTVVGLEHASSHGLSAHVMSTWTQAEELTVWTPTVWGIPASWGHLPRLRSLAFRGAYQLAETNLPTLEQVPSLSWIDLDRKCSRVSAIRERFGAKVTVQRSTDGGVMHVPGVHYLTTNA